MASGASLDLSDANGALHRKYLPKARRSAARHRATRPVGAMMRYRLLDATRAYALEISVDDIELAGLAARHATYFRRWLEQKAAEWPTKSDAAARAPQLTNLGNVRAALEWCFGIDGNIGIGVGLAAAAAPVLLAMSLLTECHRWSERAILALDDATRAGWEEMHLQAALGLSLMFPRGSTEGARVAFNRSPAVAEKRGDALDQLQRLGPLDMFHIRIGGFDAALRYARRSSAVSATTDDPAALALTHSLGDRAPHHRRSQRRPRRT